MKKKSLEKTFYLIAQYHLGELEGFIKIGDNKEDDKILSEYYGKGKVKVKNENKVKLSEKLSIKFKRKWLVTKTKTFLIIAIIFTIFVFSALACILSPFINLHLIYAFSFIAGATPSSLVLTIE